MRRYAIIGSGVAGISAAEAIRKQDPAGEITLISDDPYGYYSRPGLAYYLSGEIPEEMLYPFTEVDFAGLGARRMLGRVSEIAPEARLIRFADGASLGYDRLLIAVGASAQRADQPGVELEGVVKLDDFSDARKIVRLARKIRTAVVVGGGITALELVEGLRAHKVQVHYFLRGDRYWSNVLDEVESRIIEHRLVEEGVKLHFHTELQEVLGKRGKVSGVLTAAGEEIRCGLVAIAIGIRPRLEIARAAGLEIDRGILVNEYLQTSIEDIYAAGDVAQVFDPFSGRSVLDSLWNPARSQGYAAGLNMAGAHAPYSKGVPFNVTRLAGLTTTIIGTVGGGRDEDLLGIARGDSETWRKFPDAIAAQDHFDVNRLRVMVGDTSLKGAIVMGDQTLSKPLQHLIANEVDIRPIRDRLLQPDGPVADLISEFYLSWKWGNAPQQP